MISVQEAKEKVVANSTPLPPVCLPLAEAAGLVLATTIYAPIDIPAFDQSSMDGYAFCFEENLTATTWQVTGEVPAGHPEPVVCRAGQAVRIFTGAPVPEGADTVVMQEKVNVQNQVLSIQDAAICRGSNVRPRGSEIKSGAVAVAAGTILSPAAIGFIAGMGITAVTVYPKPKVTLLVTGKELQTPGRPLLHGQVYESNSYMLKAALQQVPITPINSHWVDDDLQQLQQVLATALAGSDMVLLTGGISVGDYDLVGQALAACGVEAVFYKVKQKPGKPLYFGKKERTLVFGLPGNPSSVLTCFYEYVVPALAASSSRPVDQYQQQLPLANAYTKPKGLTHFLKGKCSNDEVQLLQAQESYRLQSFAVANCLVVLAEEKEHYHKGDMVDVHHLPS